MPAGATVNGVFGEYDLAPKKGDLRRRWTALQRVELAPEMADAVPLIHKLARDRKLETIGLEEYFAGLYLAHREALVPFWREERELDLFVRRFCEVSEPSWWYWVDFYMWCKKNAKRIESAILQSPPVTAVLEHAAKLAIAEHKAAVGSRPQLEVRHFMSALAGHREIEFIRKMLDSGMERSKRRPRVAQRH